MLREIDTFKVGGSMDEKLRLVVLDEPGAGGACHEYRAYAVIEPDEAGCEPGYRLLGCVSFQNGPVHEAGINGVSNEILLAIVDDRLKGFQSGKFACETNEAAKVYVQHAMGALMTRTMERLARGVEGQTKE